MTDGNSPQISLRKLATVLGVSQPFLSQIRAGTGEAPPLDRLPQTEQELRRLIDQLAISMRLSAEAVQVAKRNAPAPARYNGAISAHDALHAGGKSWTFLRVGSG